MSVDSAAGFSEKGTEDRGGDHAGTADRDRLFRRVARGEGRRASEFDISGARRAGVVVRLLSRRVRDTPLRFDVMYFRRPERDADGRWNCRWIERYDMTDSAGCRKEDDREPAHFQFNMRYLRSWLWRGIRHPLFKASWRSAFPDMPGSPMITHVERLFDVLGLDTALRDRLLTDEANEAADGLYALVERTTGVVIPTAVDTRITVIIQNDSTLTVRVEPLPGDGTAYRSRNGHERYLDEHGEWTQNQLLTDIDRWSRELARHIRESDESPRYASLRVAVKELKERTRNDDEANQWND
ncbi:hypothetical protein JS532_02980 [Bifidobacterium callimiconis]|uniref:hypothetical protein n=1 Tax=Bifidobacterium callimiconis TaxID=2306973 RepID=UPI001BDD7CCB|nr:hypothetical protein [Bifidobacterium callimiconis]MBT1176529.1 hypothetical protein [Bifidobacterium callimiconis]